MDRALGICTESSVDVQIDKCKIMKALTKTDKRREQKPFITFGLSHYKHLSRHSIF